MRGRVFSFLAGAVFLLLVAAVVDGVTQVELFGRVSDSDPGSMRLIRVDRATRAMEVIDFTHHEIHDGHAFQTYHVVTSLASGANLDILLITPNTSAYCHLIYRVRSTLVTTYTIYEGTTVSGNGTALTTVNADRNSAVAAGLAAYHTPSITTTGAEIFSDSWGISTGGAIRVGGESTDTEEIVLKANTKYLLRINSGTDSNRVSIKLRWYEHVNKT